MAAYASSILAGGIGCFPASVSVIQASRKSRLEPRAAVRKHGGYAFLATAQARHDGPEAPPVFAGAIPFDGMSGWSKDAIRARVAELALEQRGDAFVAAIERFGRDELDGRERQLLYDVLMNRANLRRRIAEAARERIRSGWTSRMLEGELKRRPRGTGPR